MITEIQLTGDVIIVTFAISCQTGKLHANDLKISVVRINCDYVINRFTKYHCELCISDR